MIDRLKTRAPAVLFLLLSLLQIQANAQDFKDTAEAFSGLRDKDPVVASNAVKYLGAHPQESTPTLIRLIEEKDDRWVYAMSALTSTKQESVVPFYIELLENNIEVKDENGEREFSPFHGRIAWPNTYGGWIAHQLGVLEDRRAVPILQRAVEEGDRALKEKAYWALYQLGAASLDKLFQLGHTSLGPEANILEVIMRIGWESIHSETKLALGIYDRMIIEFPEEEYYVVSSYFWKAQCYELLHEYERAIEACDEVLRHPQFEGMVEQIRKQRAELIEKFEHR